MVRCILANGKKTTCTVKAFSHGPTAGDMRANTLMIKNKDLEFTLGAMVVNMQVSGTTGNNMDKESTRILTR